MSATNLSSTPLVPLDRKPTVGLVADSIRASIAAGAFPPGTQLTEVTLAEQLGVSRGPVREAFQRLIQEGILVAEPHRGVFVATVGPEEAADLYLARRAIEREAAREIVRRGDKAAVKRLDDLVKQMATAAKGGTWSDVADTDLAFHDALVDAAGSTRLRRMYATLLVETRLCLADLQRAHPDPRTVVAEHRALVKALRSGNESEVLGQVDRHLERAATAG